MPRPTTHEIQLDRRRTITARATPTGWRTKDGIAVERDPRWWATRHNWVYRLPDDQTHSTLSYRSVRAAVQAAYAAASARKDTTMSTFSTPEAAAEFLCRLAGRTRTTDGQISQDLIRAIVAGGMIDSVFADAARAARRSADQTAAVREARRLILAARQQ